MTVARASSPDAAPAAGRSVVPVPDQAAPTSRSDVLFTRSPVAQLDGNLEGRVVSVNPACAALLGSAPEVLLGRRLDDLLAARSGASLRDLLDGTVLGAGDTSSVACRALPPAGPAVELEVHVLLVRDPAGRPASLHLTLLDVTDREQARTALAESAQAAEADRRRVQAQHWLSGTVLDTIDVGVIACDAQGRITVCNRAARELHGVPQDRDLGQVAFDGHPVLAADGVTPLRRDELPLIRGLTEGEVVDVALTVARPGDVRAVRSDARALTGADGVVVGAVVVIKDVTDAVHAARKLQEAHQRARDIMTTAADAFVGMDEQGRITDWNPQAEASLGHTSEQAVGRNLGELLVPGVFLDAHRAGLARFLATGRSRLLGRPLELTARHRDGHEVPVELTVWSTRVGDRWQFNAFLRDIRPQLAARAALAQAHSDLADREELTRVLLDTLDVAIVTCDADGVPSSFNSAGRLLYGLPPGPSSHGLPFPHEQVASGRLAKAAVDVATGEPLRQDQRPMARALREEVVTGLELEVTDTGGRRHRILTQARALHDAAGRLLGAMCAAHDITELREREAALLASETRFRAAFDNGPLAMARLDLTGRVLEANPALRRLLALTSPQVLSSTLVELVDPADRSRAEAALAAALTAGDEPLELRLVRGDHRSVWCDVALTGYTDVGGQECVLAQLADMTDRKRTEQALIEASRRDSLTGLRNRDALVEQLSEWLAPAAAVGQVAMLFVDLDEFKLVNDTFGHEAGDTVLVAVARRLAGCLREQDLAVRFGGDEFVVVCRDLPEGQRGVADLTERLKAAVTQPVEVSGGTVVVGASIGYAVASPGQDPASVLAEADRQMYARKGRRGGAGRRGPGRPASGSAAPSSRAGALITSALDEGRLFLEYQPVHDLTDLTVVGVEALVRMRDREGVTVPPDRFIPVAEACGAIGALGEWVLEQSLAQTVLWKASIPAEHPFCVGVNVSPRQFDTPESVARLRRLVEQSPLDGTAVVLEVTEGALLADVASVRRAFDSLRETGLQLSVDDFGTGYASTRYLLTLPFSGLKIDRSYTSRLDRTGRETDISLGLTRMAVTTGLSVVAEGIETAEQRARLLAEGCWLGQGFLMSRPGPPSAVSDLLAARPRS